LYDSKFALLLIAFAVLVCTIFSTPAISSSLNSVTIRSSGRIVIISPLHVEGKYIKNAFNQTIYLRGVNKAEFADDPDGVWMGSTMWNNNNVKAELDAMKSWGVNTVRCHFSVELWKYDIGRSRGI